MTAQELTPEERAVVERFEAAPVLEEAWDAEIERVARAIYAVENEPPWQPAWAAAGEWTQERHRAWADAAIACITTPAAPGTDHDEVEIREELEQTIHARLNATSSGHEVWECKGLAAAILPTILALAARRPATEAEQAANSWRSGAVALTGVAGVLDDDDTPAELAPGIRFAVRVIEQTADQFRERADALDVAAADGGDPA